MKTSSNGSLNFIHINSYQIMDLSKESVIEISQKAEAHLRLKYQPGLYAKANDCNDIFKYMFDFYESYLDKLIPRIATAWWVASIIFQYEQSGKISSYYKTGELSKEDAIYWRKYGAIFRQALDYLCEKLCFRGEIDELQSSQQSQVYDFERALICAKKCVEYSGISNYTYMLIPHSTSVRINPIGKSYYLEHIISPEVDQKISEHIFQNNKEVAIRDSYYDQTGSPFNFRNHIKVLDENFRKEFGVTYSQFQGLIASIVVFSKKIEDPRQVPMQLKGLFFSNAAHNNEISVETVTTLLGQLILDKSQPREIWNSRQYNRINKRPFLQFESRGRTVLMWSHDKVSDFLALLDADLTFNKMPPDWKSKPLSISISEISNYAGRWFEKSAITQLATLGFLGKEIKIGTFKKYPKINFDCGQIDFLAFHPIRKCFFIFEFKMIETGFDARGIRQLSDNFLKGKDAYVTIFNRKIAWVSENISFIKDYLKIEFDIHISDETTELKSAFLTFYPTLLNLFYTEIPCKSLIQFIEDCNVNGIWPYDEV